MQRQEPKSSYQPIIKPLPFFLNVGSDWLVNSHEDFNNTSVASFILPVANTAKDKICKIANYSYYSDNDISLSISVKYETGTSTSLDDMYVRGRFYTSSNGKLCNYSK